MAKQPHLRAALSPRAPSWRKGKGSSCSAGVSLSCTSVLSPCVCLLAGGVGLAELRGEAHQQRLVKESVKGPALLCFWMSSSSPPREEQCSPEWQKHFICFNSLH